MSDGGSCSGCSVAEIPGDRVWRGSSDCCGGKGHGGIHDWSRRQESEAGRGWRWRRDGYCLGIDSVLGGRRRVSRRLSYGKGLSARVNVLDRGSSPCCPVAKIPFYRVGRSTSCRCSGERNKRVYHGSCRLKCEAG